MSRHKITSLSLRMRALKSQQKTIEETGNKSGGSSPSIDVASEHERTTKSSVFLRDRALAFVQKFFHDIRENNALDVVGAHILAKDLYNAASDDPSMIFSLCKLKDADCYTYLHSVSVCVLMSAFAKSLNLSRDQCEAAALGGLLHDVGKAFIPQELLNKPGRLTDTEFDLVKSHPRLGMETLFRNKFSNTLALDICLHHHEKMDGRGYPSGISGERILLLTRMSAICDVFDAVTSNRCYKSAWDPAEALVQMASWPGHLDRTLLASFIRLVGVYPVGSLVRLSNNLVGIVAKQCPTDIYKPVVKVFYNGLEKAPVQPFYVDLSANTLKLTILQREPRQNFAGSSIG